MMSDSVRIVLMGVEDEGHTEKLYYGCRREKYVTTF